jgi:hypothetical protein
MNLIERENRLREFFPDLRFGLSEAEIIEMEEIREDIENYRAIPESEKREVSQALQDRMQNEAEAGYVELTDEQRQKMREEWRKHWKSESEVG